MHNTYEQDIIYTDKPLEEQINKDKMLHIFKSNGEIMRWTARMTHEYEKAINKGKSHITITYEYVEHNRKFKPDIQISDTDAQVELTRIIKTRAFTHRRRRKAQ